MNLVGLEAGRENGGWKTAYCLGNVGERGFAVSFCRLLNAPFVNLYIQSILPRHYKSSVHTHQKETNLTGILTVWGWWEVLIDILIISGSRLCSNLKYPSKSDASSRMVLTNTRWIDGVKQFLIPRHPNSSVLKGHMKNSDILNSEVKRLYFSLAPETVNSNDETKI